MDIVNTEFRFCGLIFFLRVQYDFNITLTLQMRFLERIEFNVNITSINLVMQ
jgi:hypothetical protein